MQKNQVKTVDDAMPNESLMEYAQRTKGVYVNLLNLCGYNEKTKNYETMYILSNVNLTGEKVSFNNGGEPMQATVIYSCLGVDYKASKKYRNEWKKARDGLIEDYKKQSKLDLHISTHNIRSVSEELQLKAKHKKNG